MASPFAIFRRNQKLGMAILTLMAMFAFIFLDSISRSGGGGAGSNASEVVVKTSARDFDRMAINQLVVVRRNANNFLFAAWSRAAQLAADSKQRMQSQRPFQFDFGRGSLERDVVLGYLFRQEAHKLGIVVSNEAIDTFIDQVTEQKLSSTAFRDLLRELQMTGKDVYDALREELLARYYFIYSRPQPTTTPAEMWDYYKRLNVRQSLEVAAVPVSDFMAQVKDPSDTELKDYFEKHKNRLAYEYPEMEKAGFKQPNRAQLQYMTISFEEADKQIAEVTDKDITDFYEKNKETLYRNRPFPQPPATDAGQTPTEGGAASDPSQTTPPGSETPKSDTPPTEAQEGTQPPESKPEEAKPEEKSQEETKPSEPKNEEPKKEAGPTIIPDKPAEEPKSEEKKQSRTFAPESELEIADAGLNKVSAFFNLEDKEAEGEQKEESPKIEPAKPAEGEKKSEEPSTPEQKPEEKAAAETTDAETKSEPMPESEKKPEIPTEEKPATDKPAETSAEPPAEEKKEEPEFRPLDDELKAEIKDTLERQRASEKLQELARSAAEKLSDVGVEFNVPTLVSGQELYLDLNDDEKKSEGEPSVKIEGKIDPARITPKQKWALNKVVAAESAKRVSELATALGMKYGETALVSVEELKDLEGIGNSIEMENGPVNPFEANRAPVENLVYLDEGLYRPLRLEDEKGDIYVAWKSQFVPLHVPEFTDEGIKELVLKAWKLEQARPLAEKRAEALAELARKSQKSLTEGLVDQKVIPDGEGEVLKINVTDSFPWLKTTTVPGPNPLAAEVRPEMSDVPSVAKPGEKFMKKIFEELKPGEIGVTQDFDASNYYVVQVKDREPSEEALAEKRNEFFTGRLFGFSFGGMRFGMTPYDYLSDVETQQTVAEWVQRLEKSYKVEFLKEDDAGNPQG